MVFAREVPMVLDKKSEILFVITIFVALLGASRAQAQSGCGNYVINGTQVRECFTNGNNYVTFSNSCGTQTLTHDQLHAGAIPSQIVPCPRTQNQPQSSSCPTGQTRLGNGCAPYGATLCSEGG
jgi:hypothetical protein